jgi:hypothetical protein
MLARRLKAMVDAGLLTKRRYSEHPPGDEYVLTEAGAAFRLVMLALYAWSESHVTGHARKLIAIDKSTGEAIDPVVVDRRPPDRRARRGVHGRRGRGRRDAPPLRDHALACAPPWP